MQFLQIDRKTKLSDVIDIVGSRNVDSILHINDLDRSPNIGQKLVESAGRAIVNATREVDWQRKSTILNKLAGDSDLFEIAATMGSEAWKLLDSKFTFPNMLRIPDSTPLTLSNNVYGNGVPVSKTIYSAAMGQLASARTNHTISSSIFNEYSVIKPSKIVDVSSSSGGDPYQWFHIPWGDITLFSSISGESIDFPVYPEEVQDAVRANYTTMPDIIYQYEPWQLYQSSGPRQNQYSFHFHRDMWTGDHRDGGANKLIRFCEANCYPKYTGSAVHTATVTLYIKGKALITGVLTEVQTEWSGPLGLDGWYLECKLTLNITEVSPQALNYDVVKNKPLIG